MRRALLTYGVGQHEELLEIALPSFKRFAKRHGYQLLVGAHEQDRPPSWWKVPALREALDEFDEVLFIGADLVIVDSSEDLDVPTEAWQALVEHWTPDGHIAGGDFWLVRKPMRTWLERIWEKIEHRDHGWWEQAALIELMGYSFERPVRLREPSLLYERTHFLDAGWNVHKWEQQTVEHPRVMHATMYDDRAGVMRGWAELAA